MRYLLLPRLIFRPELNVELSGRTTPEAFVGEESSPSRGKQSTHVLPPLAQLILVTRGVVEAHLGENLVGGKVRLELRAEPNRPSHRLKAQGRNARALARPTA
jgi:hypothetical protein